MTKRSQRSSPYPSYTIEHCIDLVTKIYTNFGGANYYAKREEIAKVLKISAAYLQTQVSSANQYGMLDLKQGEGYKPSQLFISYYRPVSEHAKKKALSNIFKSPPLYAALIKRYGGEILPTEIPLSNILLHHHNISEGANEKAASIFIENVRYLGFLKKDNVLVLSNDTIEDTEIEEVYETTKETSLPAQIQREESPDYSSKNNNENTNYNSGGSNINAIPFNIPLKGKRTAQIIVPEDVKGTDFDFIINFINLMKQQYE